MRGSDRAARMAQAAAHRQRLAVKERAGFRCEWHDNPGDPDTRCTSAGERVVGERALCPAHERAAGVTVCQGCCLHG
jgi:hypothetical protein